MKPVPGIKKILLISPDYMSFTGIIGQGIKDNLAADVELFYTTGKESAFKYRSFFHRVQNYFSKLFLKRNLKKVFYQNAIQKKIIPFFNQHPHFDYILILRPDLILEHLPLIKHRILLGQLCQNSIGKRNHSLFR
jgi:hypothetical protein